MIRIKFLIPFVTYIFISSLWISSCSNPPVSTAVLGVDDMAGFSVKSLITNVDRADAVTYATVINTTTNINDTTGITIDMSKTTSFTVTWNSALVQTSDRISFYSFSLDNDIYPRNGRKLRIDNLTTSLKITKSQLSTLTPNADNVYYAYITVTGVVYYTSVSDSRSVNVLLLTIKGL